MENLELLDDEIVGQLNWEDDKLGDCGKMLDFLEVPVATDSPPLQNLSTSSPDSLSSWLTDIENLLMNDDHHNALPDQSPNDFLAHVLVDPDQPGDKDSSASDTAAVAAAASSVSVSVSDKEQEETEKERDKTLTDGSEHPVDAVSKKRKRQLRNRDAAVRSRERKKMYVKDLEMKSRYLEMECRRLGRLLQCFIAENQALRFSLQRGNAFGDTSAKQESAVLLLESLLLGSLLWFLGIMCLFTLPPKILVTVPPEKENAGREVVEIAIPRGAESKKLRSLLLPYFVSSRKCKGSRTRMKSLSLFLQVSV